MLILVKNAKRTKLFIFLLFLGFDCLIEYLLMITNTQGWGGGGQNATVPEGVQQQQQQQHILIVKKALIVVQVTFSKICFCQLS